MDLVERETVLQGLRDRLREAATHGQVALVAGEAGVGKTSLLRALAAGHGAVWWGACDALQTPHPLAPLLDIARDAEVRFADRLAGPRPLLFEAVLEAMRHTAAPLLVVIEDAHWADDATLDLIKFLGRRIERTRALLVVSYRDDEVTAVHPLRRVIGELPGHAVSHVQLAPLTPAGVELLARRALRSPAGLYAATAGNPFFVTELLRHRVDELPRTVQDLVLARYARLPVPAQAIVRLASIVPARIERWLVDAVLAPDLAALEACLDSGLLIADSGTLSFRHELARVAVEAALTLPAAQALHAAVLRAIDAAGRPMSHARRVHHAALAGDEGAVRRHAPAAAVEARERGAHREAVRHLHTALQCAVTAADSDQAERSGWLEAYALDAGNVDRNEDAIAARLELDAAYRRRGDVAAQAANLSRLALLYVYTLRSAQADAASRRAIELLEGEPPGPVLATVYGIEASVRMINRDHAQSAAWSRKAIALATAYGDRPRLCFSLATLGSALMFSDYAAGCRQLEASLQMARDEGLPIAEANALLNFGTLSGELMHLADAERWLREGLAYAQDRELDGTVHTTAALLALCELRTGQWDAAAQRAGDVLARASASASGRVIALEVVAVLRLRRGEPGVDATLDEALTLAGASSTLQRLAPIRSARAEAADERADPAAAAAEARLALPLALRHRHPWFIGELAYWCWRAGDLQGIPADCAEPYALQIAGQWRDAATAWQGLGCPYEQARALADGDVEAQQAALALFEQLGARPAAEALRERLRKAGVRGVVRGPRQSTREHAHGLTTRELQVLQLLCDGLRNAAIAQRLSRSVRTVDHHLAAVFAKLGVDSRVAAIQAAQRAGLVALPAQSGQAPSPK